MTFTSAKLPNALNLTYADHLMEVETITFLGLQLDNQITFKKHSTFAQEIEFCLLPHEVIILYFKKWVFLKLVYFAHCHLIVKYGIIFWGNQHNVNKVLIFQKRILTMY